MEAPRTPPDPNATEQIPRRTDHGTQMPRDLSPAMGHASLVGRYDVTGRLGKGGMGEVLEAFDPGLRRRVALKRSIAGDLELIGRFVEEAQVTAQLDHPNIVPVYELSTDEQGLPYYTMKEVRGRTLGQMLADGQTPLPRLLRVFLRICEAMAFAHSRRVLHRDLKPSNVMIGEFGEVYVLDWGLAKILDAPEQPQVRRYVESDRLAVPGAQLTQDGAVLGTLAYCSPEQAGGAGPVDERSDVYLLGGLLYEILTGRPPRKVDSVASTLQEIHARPIELASRRAPDQSIPSELEAIAARALQQAPDRRYPSAAAMAADIEAYLDGRLVSAARYGPLAAAWKWIRRNRQRLIAVGGSLALIALIVGGVVAYRRSRARAEQLGALRAEARTADGARRHDQARIAARRGLDLAPGDAELERIHQQATLALTDARAYRAALARIGRGLEALYLMYYVPDIDLADLRRRSEQTRRQLAALVDDRRYRLFPEAALKLAALYDFLGRPDQAARLIETALDRGADRKALAPLAGRVALGRAWLAILSHDQARARKQIEQARPWLAIASENEKNPGLDQALIRAGLLYAQGDRRAAREVAQTALRRHAQELGSERLWLLVGLSWLEHDKTAGDAGGNHAAIAAATRALRRRPHDALSYDLRGHAHLHQDQIERAIADFDRSVSLEPGYADAYCNRGLARVESRDYDGAIADYTRAIEIDPRVGRFYDNRGYAHQHKGDRRRALADFTRAIERDGRKAAYYANRGHLRWQLGDLGGAISDCSRAIALDPRDYKAHINRANARADRGDLDGAIVDYGAAIRLDPRPVSAHYHRGLVRAKKGDRAGPLRDQTRAIALDPRFFKAYYARGNLRYGQRDYARAIADYSKALQIHPRNVAALNNRGLARQKRGDLAGAIADYSRAIRIDPRHADAYYNRANVRRIQRDPKGAIADYSRAIQIAPRRADYLTNRGATRVGTGELAGAADDFTRALMLEPRSWKDWVNLGLVRQRQGRLAESRRAMSQALRHAPPKMRPQIQAFLEKLPR